MDVHFSGQALHCQMSRAELQRLSSGRSVELQVLLPRNHSFKISIRPTAIAADRGGWQLDSDPTGIWLTVPRAQVELLGQTTSFAERLMREFEVSPGERLQVILEVIADKEQLVGDVLEVTPQSAD